MQKNVDVFSQIEKQNGEVFAKQIRDFDIGVLDIDGIVKIVKYAGCDAEPILNYLAFLKNVQTKNVERSDAIKSNSKKTTHGLFSSLKSHLTSSSKVSFPDGYKLVRGNIVKFNHEINDIYYGDNFWIKHGIIHEINPNKEIMVDYLIFNITSRKVKNKDWLGYADGFVDILESAKNCQVTKNGKTKIINSDQYKIIIEDNDVVSVESEAVKHIGHNCFKENKTIRTVSFPNTEDMGDSCFCENKIIEKVDLSKLRKMGKFCFKKNESLKEFSAPNLEIMESSCFRGNKLIEKVDLSKLRMMYDFCFMTNRNLKEFSAPNLEEMGRFCFCENEVMKKVDLSKLRIMHDFCFCKNRGLKKISAPDLEWMGAMCFCENAIIEKVYLPKLKKMLYFCFKANQNLK